MFDARIFVWIMRGWASACDFLASLLEHPLGKVVLIFYLLFPLFLSLMFIRIIVMNLVLLTIVDC